MIKIKIRLFSSLKNHLPKGAENQDAEIEVGEASTPLQILEGLQIPLKLVHIVLIDKITLSPEEIKSRTLIEGETLTVIPPVAGG